MTCPFLKETQVRFCQMAGVRKLIPLHAGPTDPEEKCTRADFATCAVFQQQMGEPGEAARCPWLQEPLMQYCSAAPVTRFIPYSESVLSRCGNGAFRYCELYLGMAHPEHQDEDVDGVRMASWLRYTSNHMWLDVTSDGRCHAGIDAFLARVLGRVDAITYVWLKGRHRPAAVVTAGGVEHQLIFPNPMVVTGCNLYLRSNPSRLNQDPYGGGWLFEGEVLPETVRGLMGGAVARQWMHAEHGRMNEFIHENFAPAGLSADGGVVCPGIVQGLERNQAVGLFHEFFSPFGDQRQL